MNLNDLAYLVALFEHRNFARAAKACYVSQPTISTQLRKLERHLGVTLVERTRRGVVFTAAGTAVVDRARRVLADVASLELEAKKAALPESGPLRLGLFPTLGPYLLPHIIENLHRKFPNIEWLLTEEKTTKLLNQLHEGTLDAAVLADVDDADLVKVPLFHEPFMLAVPSGTDAPIGPVAVDTLTHQKLLLLDDGHCLRDQALSVCALAGAREQDGFRATSLETLRHMVGAGVGMTLLPKLATLPPVPSNNTVSVVPFIDPPGRNVALYFRPSSSQADVLEAVASEIATSAPL